MGGGVTLQKPKKKILFVKQARPDVTAPLLFCEAASQCEFYGVHKGTRKFHN